MKTFSEIEVKPSGNWFYKGNKIVQREVLDYFKKNLFEDEKGAYIKNTFHNLTEFAYINLEGYALHITDFIEDKTNYFFICETKEKLNILSLNFFLDSNQVLFVQKKTEKFLKYKISIHCLMKLSDFLIDENHFQFLECKIPILKI